MTVMRSLLLTVTLIVFTATSPARNLSLDHLLAPDGRPIQNIRSIVEDNLGYFWFSGDAGIYRYRVGELIQVETTPTTKLYLDSQDHLWAATISGVLRIDIRTLKKQHLVETTAEGERPNKLDANTFLELKNHRILLGTKLGLSVYEPKSQHLVKYLSTLPVLSLYQRGKNILVGSVNGLASMAAKITPGTQPVLVNLMLARHRIKSITQDSLGQFLLGSDNGFYILDKALKPVQKNYCNKHYVCLKGIEINALTERVPGQYWIGSGDGVFVVNTKTGNILTLTKKQGKNSLSNNLVNALHTTIAGGMLIATYSGIDFFEPYQLGLKHIKLALRQQKVINNVWSFAQQRDGALWFGTFGSGLFYSNTHHLLKFKTSLSTPHHLAANSVSSLLLENPRSLWVGTSRGLQHLDITARKFRTVNLQPQGDAKKIPPGMENIIDIARGARNEIWAATNAGFFRHNTLTHVSELFTPANTPHFQLNEWARTIQYLGDAVLVGTDKGLFRLNLNPRGLEKIAGPNYVVNMLQDSRSRIWITAADGLYLYNRKQQSLKKYADDYSQNKVTFKNACLAEAEDKQQQLWMVCDDYLYVFDLVSLHFTGLFTDAEGINLKDFLTGSSSIYRLNNGNIALGTRAGALYFTPYRMLPAKAIPEIRLRPVKVIPEQPEVNDNKPALPTQPILQQKKYATFSPAQASYEFDVFIPHYPSGKRLTLEYRITDKQRSRSKRWLTISSHDLRIRYNNLPPGAYTLNVRAKYTNSPFTYTALDFLVEPPPWSTGWAILLYIVTSLLLVYFYVKSRMRHVQAQSRTLERLVADRTSELAISKREVETLSCEKLELVENIYHQTKTPLQLMQAYLEQMKKENCSNPQKIDQISEQIFSLSRLTEQALSVSKEDGLSVNSAVERVNLANLIEPTLLAFSDIARIKKLKLNWQIADDIIAYVTPFQMRKLAENILSNAVKYTDAGSIVFHLTHLENSFRLECRDSGRGIAANDLDRLFLRGFRADNRGSVEGSGIGLYLVKQIVEQHQGTVQIESELGHGLTIRVDIPLQTTNPNPGPVPAIPSDELLELNPCDPVVTGLGSDPTAPLENRAAILIAEDNIQLASHIKSVLQTCYRVHVCLNAEDALRRAIDEVPDLILSDVMMDKMDGFQFCEQIRDNPVTAHIPFVLLTAKSDPTSRAHGFAVAANDFITKPFKSERLLQRVESQLLHVKNIRRAGSSATQTLANHTQDKLISRFLNFVEQHYSDCELRMVDVCTALHISSRQLERKVRYFIDFTPNEYLNEYRLLRAREQLQSGEPIKRICGDCGFTSQSYFSRRFKQRFGVSPSTFGAKPKGTDPSPGDLS